MPSVIVEWPHYNPLEEQDLGFPGIGPIWTWRLYNLTTKQANVDCPGGIGEIDGALDDNYKVYGVNKAGAALCSYTFPDITTRFTSGLCRISGTAINIDGSPRALHVVSVEQDDITISKLTTALGKWFFYLQPGAKPQLYIEPDNKVFWFEVPNQNEVSPSDLKNYGYYIPRRPLP